jgi:hypothetical protein
MNRYLAPRLAAQHRRQLETEADNARMAQSIGRRGEHAWLAPRWPLSSARRRPPLQKLTAFPLNGRMHRTNSLRLTHNRLKG